MRAYGPPSKNNSLQKQSSLCTKQTAALLPLCSNASQTVLTCMIEQKSAVDCYFYQDARHKARRASILATHVVAFSRPTSCMLAATC
jgi:hypothetical protein